jgi:CubicO group peptidase (beta-lactamase class C family)
MLLRHGTVIAEGWWHPYRPETPHMLFSLSKSFTSTAVGLAVAEGRLSVNDSVLKFFPEDAPKKISKNLAAMQVRHLLSMVTGHDQDASERTMRGRSNPFKNFLSLEVEHEPGTFFVYNSAATYMLAAIVQKLTGQTLVEYLTPRLFEPLGIEGATWETHPNGVNFGGWGLNIKTEDIARFGQLYLQKGMWQGKQLLPAYWVEAASSKQVSNELNKDPDWKVGYGYQFWRCRHDHYRGDGAFGQYCIVMPELDIVLAITGGMPDMQVPLDAVWDKLLPGIGAASLPADKTANEALAKLLSGLKINPSQEIVASPLETFLSGKTYIFEKNDEKFQSVIFDFKGNNFTYKQGGKQFTLPFGRGTWREGTAIFGHPSYQRIVTSGAWTKEDTFVLSLCQYETPFTTTFTCRFAEDKVYCDIQPNVSFEPGKKTQLAGKYLE